MQMQPSLRRLAQFGIRPNRELGQNFLIDSNILGVIATVAELDKSDVVLEVGGGLGVLSEYLARHAKFAHVVEVDSKLEPALRDALDAHVNTNLHMADILELDLAALTPAPNKLIANLPYGVAATTLLQTIEGLDGINVWVAMVQREVGERLAAAPNSRSYGIPSVIAQLACEVKVVRAISRKVFYPEPNVDSVLVKLVRRGSAPGPELRRLVQRGFAHRRKTLAASLALSASEPKATRRQLQEALTELGRTPDTRAEQLSPDQWRALYEVLANLKHSGGKAQ